MTRDRVIGKRGDLPWKLKGDLPRFKKMTWGKTVIMGRRTFDSIGRPLPGRNNVVLDDQRRAIAGADVAGSLDEALQRARVYNTDIFVIGGASVYEQLLSQVEVLHISHVKKDYEGDVYFPAYNTADWESVGTEEFEEFTAITYRRIRHVERA